MSASLQKGQLTLTPRSQSSKQLQEVSRVCLGASKLLWNVHFKLDLMSLSDTHKQEERMFFTVSQFQMSDDEKLPQTRLHRYLQGSCQLLTFPKTLYIQPSLQQWHQVFPRSSDRPSVCRKGCPADQATRCLHPQGSPAL